MAARDRLHHPDQERGAGGDYQDAARSVSHLATLTDEGFDAATHVRTRTHMNEDPTLS